MSHPADVVFKSSASISFISLVPQIHFMSVYPLCTAPLNYSHHSFRLFKLSYEQPEHPAFNIFISSVSFHMLTLKDSL